MMPRGLSRRPSCAGFTLTELAIVLMVVAFVTGAIWLIAARTWGNYRIAHTAQEITKLTQNIREFYMSSGSMVVGDDTVALDGNSLFPLEMRRNPSGGAGGPIDHPMNADWPGGSLHVVAENCVASAALLTCFRVRLLGVTQNDCVGILKEVPVNNADLNIVQVGTQNMANNLSGAGLAAGVAPSTANTWCNLAGNNNEVDWDFRLH